MHHLIRVASVFIYRLRGSSDVPGSVPGSVPGGSFTEFSEPLNLEHELM